jgi:pantetheine-phosphate adenylyltransferase
MEHEFGMAFLNRKLAPNIETIFLMPDENHAYLSSSAVREIAFYGGSLSCFVTKCVEEALRKKVEEIKANIHVLKE